MVAYTVIYGYVHIPGVKHGLVGFQTFFITDVSRVDDEGSLLIVGIRTYICHPLFLSGGGRNFRVRDLHEMMGPSPAYVGIVGTKCEVIVITPFFNGVVMACSLVTAGDCNKKETLPLMSGQFIRTVALGLYHMTSVGHHDSLQGLLAFVEGTVSVGIHKNPSLIGSSQSRQGRQAAQKK